MKIFAIITLALALPLQGATAANGGPGSPTVVGQKIDSGLGDLPHYRLWADPTGKRAGLK